MADNLPSTVKVDVPMTKGVFDPQSLEQAWRVAELYSRSGMAPKNYIGNPAAIVVAGQFGAQLGLGLLPSLQGIAVVNGMPSLWGDVQLAVARNSETVETLVEYFEGTFPNSEFKAICIAKRKGLGAAYDPKMSLDDARKAGLFVNEFSIADATTAGLWKKSGTWTTNPKRMLKMRARAFTLRDGWPDILKGMHSVEEMIGADITMAETTPGTFDMPEEEISTEAFDDLVRNRILEGQESLLDKFLTITAEKNDGLSVDQLKVAAAGNFDGFWGTFEAWVEKQKPTEGPREDPRQNEEKAKEQQNFWINRNEWINKGNAAFKGYVLKDHKDELLEVPAEIQDEVFQKWLRMGNAEENFPVQIATEDGPTEEEQKQIELAERLSVVPDDVKEKAVGHLKCSTSPPTIEGKIRLLACCNKLAGGDKY